MGERFNHRPARNRLACLVQSRPGAPGFATVRHWLQKFPSRSLAACDRESFRAPRPSLERARWTHRQLWKLGKDQILIAEFGELAGHQLDRLRAKTMPCRPPAVEFTQRLERRRLALRSPALEREQTELQEDLPNCSSWDLHIPTTGNCEIGFLAENVSSTPGDCQAHADRRRDPTEGELSIAKGPGQAETRTPWRSGNWFFPRSAS